MSLGQVEAYKPRRDLPPPYKSSIGEICYHPLSHREVARQILYGDWLVGECNKQIKEREDLCQGVLEKTGSFPWDKAVAVAASIVGVGVGVAVQELSVVSAGAAGLLVIAITW